MSLRHPLTIITSAFSLIACTARADFQRIDGFDDRPLGDLIGQADWFATTDTAAIVADPVDSENHVLAVRTNSGILRRPLVILRERVQMLFFRLRFGDQQNYSIGLSALSNPSEFNDFGPEIGMANQNNDLRVWEGDLSMYLRLASLSPDTWYNVWMLIDNANDSLQLWINDSEGAPAQGSDQIAVEGNSTFGFRLSGPGDLRTFYIKTGGGQPGMGSPDGPVYLDDIYLEKADGFPNLQNPTSLAPLRVTDFEVIANRAAIEWEPPAMEVFVLHSTDLSKWVTLDGPVSRGNWEGDFPADQQRSFLRLVEAAP